MTIEHLLELAEPILQKQSRRLLNDQTIEDQEDAMQNVRLLILRRIGPRFDPAEGDAEPYLARCINRAMRDERRRLRVRAGAGVTFALQDGEVVDHRAPADFEAEAICQAIATNPHAHLPPRLAALVDILLVSPSRAGAAKQLGVTRQTVHRMTNRIRHRLTEILCPVPTN